jgi:hypothetical protein
MKQFIRRFSTICNTRCEASEYIFSPITASLVVGSIVGLVIVNNNNNNTRVLFEQNNLIIKELKSIKDEQKTIVEKDKEKEKKPSNWSLW